MRKILKKSIFLVFAILILVYIVICDVFMTFSITMNLCFIFSAILMLILQYFVNNPVDEEEMEPKFIYIFVKIATFLFFFTFIFAILFNCLYPKNYIHDKDYDYIVVFGAGVSEGKNQIMNSRLDTAIIYARKYKRCKFVLTGAKGKNEPITEALYMKNYMVESGIDERNILVEPFSVNTSENVFNSLKLIKEDIIRRNFRENIITRPFKNDLEKFDLDFVNIGFMSSEFHLTRINLMAKKLGIYHPYDIPCETKLFYRPYLYVREDLSLFKAFVLNQLKF